MNKLVDTTPMLDDEKVLVMLSGMVGFLGNDSNFNNVYGAKELRKQARLSLSKIIEKINMEDKKFKKVYNKVQQGKLKVVVLAPHEMENNKRKYLDSDTKINREALITLQEHALSVCEDCKRQRSKCTLRKALIKSNAPTTNDGQGKCQFNWMEE